MLITAKDSGSGDYDRLFLVSGQNDGDCMKKFRAYARRDDDIGHDYLGVDLRTIKYLGDGAEIGKLTVTDPYGVVELDTTNNQGYSIKILKD